MDLQPLFFRLPLDSATEFLLGESVHSLLVVIYLRRKILDTNSTTLRQDLQDERALFHYTGHTVMQNLTMPVSPARSCRPIRL